MTAVTITFSEEEFARVRQQATEQGFANVEEYVQTIVTIRLWHDRDEDGEREYVSEPPPVITKAQLEAMALEGLASPSREMTKQDFADMRRELVERYVATRLRQKPDSSGADPDSVPHSGQR